jgi:hypothetical protein
MMPDKKLQRSSTLVRLARAGARRWMSRLSARETTLTRDLHVRTPPPCGPIALTLLVAATLAGCDHRALPHDPAPSSTAPEGSHPADAPRTLPPPPAPVAQSAEPKEKRSPDYRHGYEEGVAEAEREITGNGATIYVDGMRRVGDGLDRETGLNTTAIAGCSVDDTLDGRADGHNATVRDFIKKHGSPAYSRKRWESDLFALPVYFKTRGAADVEVLRIGGRDVALEKGRVRLSARPDGLRVHVDGVQVTLRVAGEVRTTLDMPLSEVPRRTEVTLGPEGSDTILFRLTFRDGSLTFGVLDARNGEWIRREDWLSDVR